MIVCASGCSGGLKPVRGINEQESVDEEIAEEFGGCHENLLGNHPYLLFSILTLPAVGVRS